MVLPYMFVTIHYSRPYIYPIFSPFSKNTLVLINIDTKGRNNQIIETWPHLHLYACNRLYILFIVYYLYFLIKTNYILD